MRGSAAVAAISVLALLRAGGAASEAQGPRITPLRVSVQGNEVSIDFALQGAVNPDLARRIESGLTTAIKYEIRLYVRNRYWWDEKLEIHSFTVSTTYDPIRRQYVVSESFDGSETSRRAIPEFAEAVRLMTAREGLKVFQIREGWPRKNLYVMMRARFNVGQFFALVPVDSTSPWKKSKAFRAGGPAAASP